MKREYSEIPESFYGREMKGVSWMDYVTAIPSLIFVATSYKEDKKVSVSMEHGISFSGDQDGFYAILTGIKKTGKLYKAIQEKKEIVLNFFSEENYEKYLENIQACEEVTDGILMTGFSAESAKVIDAPRIKECFLNLECRYLWEHEIKEENANVILCFEVVHVCIEEEHLDETTCGRYGEKGYLYKIHSPINPEQFEGKSEDWMGIMKKHKKIRDTKFPLKRNETDSAASVFLFILIAMLFIILITHCGR